MFPSGTQPRERDMTKYQQGLVDSCFEEGQYEAGIAILDQLRAPTSKPSPIHIRALLYMALLPPHSTDLLESGALTASPTKFDSPQKVRQKKLSLEPTPAATEAALRLLFALGLTNSPQALLRAVPSYGVVDEDEDGDLVTLVDTEEDSHIAREARCIADCRFCLDILKEGFIIRRESTRTQEGRRKKRSRGDDNLELEVGFSVAQIVAPHAWPVLEWCVNLFEKDEELRESRKLGHYSTLLLSQIPRPKSGKGGRWDAQALLDVIFYCFEQDLVARRRLGARLACMMARLAQSREIDLVMFVDNILARLHIQETSIFNAFISAIPPTSTGHAFKILLCKQYLASLATRGTKPRPQVRAQPRRRGMASAEAPLASDSGTIAPVSALVEATAKVQSPDILRLLSQTSPTATRSQCARMKFELISAYDMLQRRADENAKDMEWTSVIQNGSLHQIFDSSLAVDDDGTDHRDLQEMAALKELLVAMLSP